MYHLENGKPAVLSVVLCHSLDSLGFRKLVAYVRLSVDLIEEDYPGFQRPGESFVCLSDDRKHGLKYDELKMS